MYDISYSPSHHHQVRHKNSQREVMCFRAYVLEMLSHLKGHRFRMKDWHEDKYKFYVSWCQSFVSNYKAVPKFGRLRRLVLWPCLLAWCATLPGVHVGELFIASRILQQPKLCNCKKTCGVGNYNEAILSIRSVCSSVCLSDGLTRPLKWGGVSAQE